MVGFITCPSFGKKDNNWIYIYTHIENNGMIVNGFIWNGMIMGPYSFDRLCMTCTFDRKPRTKICQRHRLKIGSKILAGCQKSAFCALGSITPKIQDPRKHRYGQILAMFVVFLFSFGIVKAMTCVTLCLTQKTRCERTSLYALKRISKDGEFRKRLWDQNWLHDGAIQLKWQPNAYRSGLMCCIWQIWEFPSMWVPENGWFIMEHPTDMID